MSRVYPTWDGWERQTITIQVYHKDAQVEALVKAGCPFALTPTPHSDQLWNVTHIPTGHALAIGILKPHKALTVIEVALASPVAWDTVDLGWFAAHKNDPDYAAALVEIRRTITKAF